MTPLPGRPSPRPYASKATLLAYSASKATLLASGAGAGGGTP
jgi:hypothetical protein